jgi:hypothetical protein
MKTAVLLSGQGRYIPEHADGIRRNLIDPNNADVYVHTWDSSELTGQPFRSGAGWANERLSDNQFETIKSLYNPVTITIQKQKEFPLLDIDFTNTLANNMGGGAENPETKKHYILATQSMWYSINRVFNLISTEYDAVILTRFDLGISRPVKITDYDMSYIYGEDIGRPELLLNWMNFGSASNMRKVFGMMYHNILSIYNRSNIWCNEFWCQYSCSIDNLIPVKKTGWGLTIPSRQL